MAASKPKPLNPKPPEVRGRRREVQMIEQQEGMYEDDDYVEALIAESDVRFRSAPENG